jgi:CHRD domain
MLEKKSLSIFLLASAILSLIIVPSITENFTYAQPIKFKAKLKGDNEVPPVNTTATGTAKFTIKHFKVKDDVISSKINVTGITNLTGAHIYAGNNSEIGQPIVDLLKSGKENKTQDRLIITADIKASDFEGLMKGKTLEDLRTAMASEGTFVNIQTSDHPDGQIRGQIKVSGSNATQPESFNTTSTATNTDAPKTSNTDNSTDAPKTSTTDNSTDNTPASANTRSSNNQDNNNDQSSNTNTNNPENYDDFNDLVHDIRNHVVESNDISLNAFKDSGAYQGADQQTQDCIDLAGKIGNNLGDQEIVHCSEDPNFYQNQISNNDNNNSNNADDSGV